MVCLFANPMCYGTCFIECIFYYRESNRNLNKGIYEHKTDFKTGNSTNSLISPNILTNHTFDFQNSAIFAFIHDKNKRVIIEVCPIAYHNTIPQ